MWEHSISISVYSLHHDNETAQERTPEGQAGIWIVKTEADRMEVRGYLLIYLFIYLFI